MGFLEKIEQNYMNTKW